MHPGEETKKRGQEPRLAERKKGRKIKAKAIEQDDGEDITVRSSVAAKRVR